MSCPHYCTCEDPAGLGLSPLALSNRKGVSTDLYRGSLFVLFIIAWQSDCSHILAAKEVLWIAMVDKKPVAGWAERALREHLVPSSPLPLPPHPPLVSNTAPDISGGSAWTLQRSYRRWMPRRSLWSHLASEQVFLVYTWLMHLTLSPFRTHACGSSWLTFPNDFYLRNIWP